MLRGGARDEADPKTVLLYDGQSMVERHLADQVTLISTGNDSTTGANKLTGDMMKIASQVPALFEALSGMNVAELMANVKSMQPRKAGDASATAGN